MILWKWTWLTWKIIFKIEHCVWSTSVGLPEDQIASSVRVWVLASLSITSTKYWYLHCTCEHDLLVSWSSAPCWWKWSSLEPLLSLLVFTIIFLQQFEIQSHGNLPLVRAWFILQFSGSVLIAMTINDLSAPNNDEAAMANLILSTLIMTLISGSNRRWKFNLHRKFLTG